MAGDENATGYTYIVSGKPYRLASVSFGVVSNTLSYDDNGDTIRYTPSSGASTFLEYDAQCNVTHITRGASVESDTPEARVDACWAPSLQFLDPLGPVVLQQS